MLPVQNSARARPLVRNMFIASSPRGERGGTRHRSRDLPVVVVVVVARASLLRLLGRGRDLGAAATGCISVEDWKRCFSPSYLDTENDIHRPNANLKINHTHLSSFFPPFIRLSYIYTSVCSLVFENDCSEVGWLFLVVVLVKIRSTDARSRRSG